MTDALAFASDQLESTSTSGRRVIAGDDARISLFDFYHQERVDRSRLRVFEAILDSLAHRIGNSCAATVRQPAQVTVGEYEQMAWEEYASAQPDPTFLSTAIAMPLDGRLLLHLPPPMILQIIDLYLGGDGTTDTKRNQLTDIERVLIAPFIEECWKGLIVAVSSAIELRLGLIQSATSPLLVQIGRPGETCLVVNMQVSINEQSHNDFQLCMPISALLPILLQMESQNDAPPPEVESPESRERLRIIPVEVRACYPPITLTTTELFNLRPGHVITIRDGNPEENTEVDLVTGEVIVGTAMLIEQGNKLACSVISKREDPS